MEPVPVSAEDAEMIRWLGEEAAAQMVEDLPAEQRDAIRAHVLEDRDYADIASSQQLSEATVRKRVSRGLRVLRERAGGNQMSSDYITRLRHELLRAGCDQAVRSAARGPGAAPARGRSRRRARRAGRRARVAARRRATVTPGRAGGRHAPLTYRGEPSSARASAHVMRERLDGGGRP